MSAKIVGTAVLAVLIMLSLNYSSAQAASGQSEYGGHGTEIVVKNAAVLSASHVLGENRVYIGDSGEVRAALGTFERPGAYVEIAVTVENTGDQSVYLAGVETELPAIADFRVDVPRFDVTRHELTAGDQCEFTVVVCWDGASERSILSEETGEFTLRLTYVRGEASGAAPDTSGGASSGSNAPQSPPQTGDTGCLSLWLALAVLSMLGTAWAYTAAVVPRTKEK